MREDQVAFAIASGDTINSTYIMTAIDYCCYNFHYVTEKGVVLNP